MLQDAASLFLESNGSGWKWQICTPQAPQACFMIAPDPISRTFPSAKISDALLRRKG